MGLQGAINCIREHKNFVITAHTNPEGDSLGSQLALRNLLRKLGKRAVIINEDSSPYCYSFLPGVNKIKKYIRKEYINFECLIVLDCSDLLRTGEVYKLNTRNRTILNIDHHISNENFGTVNWIDAKASSCSEMIYKLYKRFGSPIGQDSAILLYTGIVTDTGSFRYVNTTSFTHKAAAELLRSGINITGIYKKIYEDVPFADMKLLSSLLPTLKLEKGGKIAWIAIKRKVLAGKKLSFDLTEHLLAFARAIKGVEVVALFKENLGEKGTIRVNLRSRGTVDVNAIASSFGGGGHRSASGATIVGRLEDVRKTVLEACKYSLGLAK